MASCILNDRYQYRARNQGVPGAQDSLDFSCCSRKVMKGAQRFTVLYTEHLKVAFEDAVGLPGKKLNFEPSCI